MVLAATGLAKERAQAAPLLNLLETFQRMSQWFRHRGERAERTITCSICYATLRTEEEKRLGICSDRLECELNAISDQAW